MNWFQLITELLPIFAEVEKAIADAEKAGTPAATSHQAIVDHVAQLPSVVRAAAQ
jgi:hypothetical protein